MPEPGFNSPGSGSFGNYAKQLASAAIGKALGVPGGGGGGFGFGSPSNISSSQATTTVSVNPSIVAISGGGTATPSTNGYATSSPVQEAKSQPNNPYQPYGQGRPSALGDVDANPWGSLDSSNSTTDIIPGIPDLLLFAGAGAAAFFLMKG